MSPKLEMQSCLIGYRVQVRRGPLSEIPVIGNHLVSRYQLLFLLGLRSTEQRRRQTVYRSKPGRSKSGVTRTNRRRSLGVFRSSKLGSSSSKDATPSDFACFIGRSPQMFSCALRDSTLTWFDGWRPHDPYATQYDLS